MRFAQTGWIALAFLLSSVATGYYLLVWPKATFQQCWNGYFLIPIEERWMHEESDLKGCRETSAAEGVKGNVRAAELAASLYTRNDGKKKTEFFCVEQLSCEASDRSQFLPSISKRMD